MDVFSPGVAASHPTDRVGTFSVGVMVTVLTTFRSEDDWGVIGVTWNKNIADIFCRELVEFVLGPHWHYFLQFLLNLFCTVVNC